MSKLDDAEQAQYLDRWIKRKELMAGEIRQVKTAHRYGAITWVSMQIRIHEIRRKYRRAAQNDG